jgi:dihydroneopterin aldolase
LTDTVFIEGLRLHTVIGVYDWERTVRQELTLDLEMSWPIGPAAASDDVHKALDYALVSERVQAHAAHSTVQLIETLAQNIATLVLEEFGVTWLRLRLCKPGAVSSADNVGVVIERGRGAA